jgi:adenine-specific DNA-methyltransferase
MAKQKKKEIKMPAVKYRANPDRTVIPVTSHKHKDKRVNIPTEELRAFVAEQEIVPKTMLYPRDPSLDPQLVWKGKDDQDAQPLEVPVVPIYIQEKIQPRALIEDIRAQSRKDNPEDQIGLFSDFNGIDFQDQIDFYHHEQNWTNRMILGDSMLVMASLAEKEGLKGRVQTIYVDPPYGIKFGSNWQVSTRKRDVKDGKAESATRQPEQVKAFRDTWQLGIHSYLAYLRDRFKVSRDLLSESGSIFVQIGDENIHLVRSVLDEIFGSENFFAIINYRSMTPLGQKGIARVYDYILWYSKNIEVAKFRPLFINRVLINEPEFCYLDFAGSHSKLGTDSIEKLKPNDLSKVFKRSVLTSSGYTPSCTYQFEFEGRKYSPLSGKSWRTHPDGMKRLVDANRIIALGQNPYYRQYHSDFSVIQMENSWHDTAAGYSDEKTYVVQTSDRIVQRCLLMTTDPGDLVLDPTCGSGTTAFVAEQWGRRWMTIDTSRVALALARTRLMSAKYPYYYLADSVDGIKKESEVAGTVPTVTRPENDIKKGFLYRRIPHIELKAIANNDEIDPIHARWAAKLETLRKEINRASARNFDEWQIPREPETDWSEKSKNLLAEWWDVRKLRQDEINESISRHAETVSLFDQPYEDNKRVRVAGPFTVESLSPHRVLSTEGAGTESAASERDVKEQQDFVAMILENIRKSGVQNTIRKERLKFDRLEPYAGLYIHAAGEYTEEGKTKRCAVYVGPEHGTVGPNEVKDAAKEAVKGVGFDLLIICGFAFDPHVSEETKQYGSLTVLAARMNPDLAMGEELLKKTGAGNLFMVFGEPDIEIKKEKGGKIVVSIHGLDVYDPTTGEIRSNTTDDIACWFIDTNYNEESFFVRHAYFTGAQEPYEKLKRALRADIDEAAWSALYSTVSRPFDPPKNGKIAVKVINHYGDEVLKVFEIS